MSHTLHRTGSVESLQDDYVSLCLAARGFNRRGTNDKGLDHVPSYRKYLELGKKHHAINESDGKFGSLLIHDYDWIYENCQTVVHAMFDDKDNIAGFLKDLADAEIGYSVVVSGLFDNLFECCRHAHITPHGLTQALGVMGRTDELPDEKAMELTSMCGHAQVSVGMVNNVVQKIKSGEITTEEAGLELAMPCTCGVFNFKRAAKLLEEYCALYGLSVE